MSDSLCSFKMLVYHQFLIAIFLFGTFAADDTFSCKNTRIELRGAGSSFPAHLYQEIGSKFAANRLRYDRMVDYVYERRNSGYGKARITTKIKGEKPVLFGATEAVLPVKDRIDNPALRTFPVLAGAVVIIYNLPDLEEGGNYTLALSTQSLVGIYNGTVQYWDDVAIEADNPDILLPHEHIRVVVRSDTAGDTDIFTHALGQFDQQWAIKYGASFLAPGFVTGRCCNSTNWPPYVIEFFANRVTGMVGIVGSIPYTIGYAALANVQGFDVSIADLINKAGKQTAPSIKAVQAAIDYHFAESAGSMLFRLSNALHRDAYPIASFSYLIVNSSTHPSVSCCQAVELAGFIDSLLSEVEYFEKYSLVPASENIARQIRRSVLNTLTCGERSTYQMYLKSMESDETPDMVWKIVAGGIGGMVLIIFILGSVYIWKMRQARLADETKWVIPSGSIHFSNQNNDNILASRLSLQSLTADGDNSPAISAASGSIPASHASYMVSSKLMRLKYVVQKGDLDEVPVFLAVVKLAHPTVWRKESKRMLAQLKEGISHNNLAGLIGVTVTNGRTFTVFEFGEKGTLHFVLQTCRYELTDPHKFNMACDVAKGMSYLHRKGLVHGLLSSITCYMDNSWTIKIAMWEQLSVLSTENPKEFLSQIGYKEDVKPESLIKMLYSDPEITGSKQQSFDIYSFGMLLIEIFTQKLPFSEEVEDGTTSHVQIVKDKFSSSFVLPKLDNLNIPKSTQRIICACFGHAKSRPGFDYVLTQLQHANPSKKGIVDIMMDTMENYMQTLETKVQERTTKLQEVTNRMEVLLHEVLPPVIAEKLFRGETVPPESFDSVTVYFSDIVGFTTISSKSTPLQVMAFLNDLWVAFDNTIDQFDVYKVDTIGDAYMVCSGLPQRNGINHVKHIAELSFALLENCSTFQIRHMPLETLKIRIGMNSGRVTAGIVGTKMPQYCVFGDTVNVASRMESTSIPFHIQVSESSHDLLEEHFPQYKMTPRGNVEVKGKGQMKTYWLKPPIDHPVNTLAG